MYQFNIQGGTNKQQEILEQVTEWTLPKLITPKLESQLELTFTVKRKINGDDELAGICIWLDRGCKPRELEIFISSKHDEKGFISTTMHELTHLSQYMTGRLKHKLTDNNFYWDNQLVDTDNTDYWDLPWENEAIFNEVCLFDKWKKETFYNPINVMFDSEISNRSLLQI